MGLKFLAASAAGGYLWYREHKKAQNLQAQLNGYQPQQQYTRDALGGYKNDHTSPNHAAGLGGRQYHRGGNDRAVDPPVYGAMGLDVKKAYADEKRRY